MSRPTRSAVTPDPDAAPVLIAGCSGAEAAPTTDTHHGGILRTRRVGAAGISRRIVLAVAIAMGATLTGSTPADAAACVIPGGHYLVSNEKGCASIAWVSGTTWIGTVQDRSPDGFCVRVEVLTSGTWKTLGTDCDSADGKATRIDRSDIPRGSTVRMRWGSQSLTMRVAIV